VGDGPRTGSGGNGDLPATNGWSHGAPAVGAGVPLRDRRIAQLQPPFRRFRGVQGRAVGSDVAGRLSGDVRVSTRIVRPVAVSAAVNRRPLVTALRPELSAGWRVEGPAACRESVEDAADRCHAWPLLYLRAVRRLCGGRPHRASDQGLGTQSGQRHKVVSRVELIRRRLTFLRRAYRRASGRFSSRSPGGRLLRTLR